MTKGLWVFPLFPAQHTCDLEWSQVRREGVSSISRWQLFWRNILPLNLWTRRYIVPASKNGSCNPQCDRKQSRWSHPWSDASWPWSGSKWQRWWTTLEIFLQTTEQWDRRSAGSIIPSWSKLKKNFRFKMTFTIWKNHMNIFRENIFENTKNLIIGTFKLDTLHYPCQDQSPSASLSPIPSEAS